VTGVVVSGVTISFCRWAAAFKHRHWKSLPLTLVTRGTDAVRAQPAEEQALTACGGLPLAARRTCGTGDERRFRRRRTAAARDYRLARTASLRYLFLRRWAPTYRTTT